MYKTYYIFFRLSKLLEKHKFNFDSAKYLIEESMYAPSVHCSYYSCFQLMKHKVRNLQGCSYEDLDAEIIGISSHSFLINKVKFYLDPKNNAKIKDPALATEFKDSIRDLKKFRKESDYDNKEISPDEADKAFNFSRNISLILNKL